MEQCAQAGLPPEANTRRPMMTAAHLTVAHCGEVSALTLGRQASEAIPAQKGTLPKGLFVAKAPVSSKLKQRLVNAIASITMLALLRPANTAMGAGSGKMPEVLVIGLRVNTPGIPVEVIDLIAGQRKPATCSSACTKASSKGRDGRSVGRAWRGTSSPARRTSSAGRSAACRRRVSASPPPPLACCRSLRPLRRARRPPCSWAPRRPRAYRGKCSGSRGLARAHTS